MSRRASSYEKKLIEWLWPGHFALGMLGLIDGDPSRGKSQLVSYMAGRITTGQPWPDGTPCPIGGVVIVGGEDPVEEVVIPRLEAVGADLRRVTPLAAKDDGSPIRLPEDILFLESEIRAVDARLIAFDPIMSALTAITNPNSDKDVRQALTPLNEVLVRNRCAGLMLRHFNKTDKVSQALYRGMASIAFGALARSGFAVAKDPDAQDGYIFAPTKNNISRYPSSLKYQIADVDLGNGFNTSRIEWRGESQRSAEELVTAFGADKSKAADAEQMIAGWLDKGPMLSDVLLDRCKEAGISFATYRRAQESIGCKHGQHKSKWYVRLPEHDHLWELMRQQMLIVGDFQTRPPTHIGEHLNLNHEHLVKSDAQMLKSGVNEHLAPPPLADEGYWASVVAEAGG